MTFLENYLNRIRENNIPLAKAISETVGKIVPTYINNFSYRDHVRSLLVGDVQSGKTSHMFGLMAAAADAGFGLFILLTTDNILLQEQTFARAQKDLEDFLICDENDYQQFVKNRLKKPVVIVLKKNARILRTWRDNLRGTDFVLGNPLFIIDDEADASSLNTKVNSNEQSSINKQLDEITGASTSSIYLQVTGTPQAVLLQTMFSTWKPYFIHYFKPGKSYIGGNFFFGNQLPPKQVVLTDDEESNEILEDDEFPENGLKKATITHLISSAEILTNRGGDVCNFLIHPSVKTAQHQLFAEKVGEYLNEILLSHEEENTINTFKNEYENLKKTSEILSPFEDLYKAAISFLKKDSVKILVLNSKSEFVDSSQYTNGINILVGGNSLGRGVTFPKLQTIYYCRLSKRPQADTMWQHTRMFGYDRETDLIRLYMPPTLYKLFSDINSTNNNIISQILRSNNDNSIRIIYPDGLHPTRKNVIDTTSIKLYSGGVNYFPFYPVNTDTNAIDSLLNGFDDLDYPVSLNIIIKCLEHVNSEIDDWDSKVFIGFIKAFLAENPQAQGRLIVRRNRDIARGTGTVLSPNDRKLGAHFTDEVVLTMYKVTGAKGWNGKQIWIPNIKLPSGKVYYLNNK